MADLSPHQQKIVKRYYDNRDEIAIQRLQELASDLYLTEGKKRQQHWKNVAKHLEALEVKPEQIAHIVGSDNPALLADYLKNLVKKH